MGKYVAFNRDAFIRDLTNALAKIMDEIDTRIYATMVTNLQSVRLRKLDAGSLDSMVRSINHASSATIGRVINTYEAGGGSKPNQSFRAIYYEYGTGTSMRPPKGYSPLLDPYWNPARPTAVGVGHHQRPNSSWKDMGGNWHTSRTRGKPKFLSTKSRRGEEVQPHFWFSKAIEQETRNLDSLILSAVKSLPLTSYISIRDIVVRM